jgi:hypothetical protein
MRAARGAQQRGPVPAVARHPCRPARPVLPVRRCRASRSSRQTPAAPTELLDFLPGKVTEGRLRRGPSRRDVPVPPRERGLTVRSTRTAAAVLPQSPPPASRRRGTDGNVCQPRKSGRRTRGSRRARYRRRKPSAMRDRRRRKRTGIRASAVQRCWSRSVALRETASAVRLGRVRPRKC